MTVDKKGKYSYTFKDGVAEYYLKVGNWVTPVFSKDNDKLSADIVVADKTVDVKFKGRHAAENNYLCMLTTLQNYPSATDPGSYQAVAAEKIYSGLDARCRYNEGHEELSWRRFGKPIFHKADKMETGRKKAKGNGAPLQYLY